MKTLLYTLKPYRAQCAFIILVALADVGGSLLVPTITANMINSAIAGGAIGHVGYRAFIRYADVVRKLALRQTFRESRTGFAGSRL